LALVGLGVGTALLQPRLGGGEPSPLPAADNPGPRGLAAARELLRSGGAAVEVLRAGDPPVPGAGAGAVVLAAPTVTLTGPDADALLARARAGAAVVVALGRAPQPALLQALGLELTPGDGPAVARGLAPHRLVGDLTLPARGAALRTVRPGPLAVSGGEGWASAVSVPAGPGEVLVLSGPEPLENEHLLEGDAVTLVTRLGALGPVVLDERFLAPAPAPAPVRGGRSLVPLALQLLLAGLAAVAARARRLGAVRPAPAAAPDRTARAYLASLAALYRRAGAEDELAAAAWRALRRRLERRHGVPATLSDAEAARRVARRSGAAAVALARGGAALAGRGPGVLLGVTRAAADVEAGLGGR
jgi:hypothetical protein